MRDNRPDAGRIRRAARRLGLDRNPMRRRTDRLQVMLRAGLLTLLVTGVPAAAFFAGHSAYVSALRTGRAQAAHWHRTPAVVLRVTDKATGWQHSRPLVATWSVRWRMPDGSSRTAEVASTGKAVPGSAVRVWLNQAGRLTRPPLSRADAAGRAGDAAAAAAAAMTVLLGAVERVTSRMLDRRRLAGWEADWSAVEPQWTRRR